MVNDSSNYYTMTDYPCCWCVRKNCTMSTSYGGRCEFAMFHENPSILTGCSETEPRKYVKKQKNKKKVYHRGKF